MEEAGSSSSSSSMLKLTEAHLYEFSQAKAQGRQMQHSKCRAFAASQMQASNVLATMMPLQDRTFRKCDCLAYLSLQVTVMQGQHKLDSCRKLSNVLVKNSMTLVIMSRD